MSLDATTTAPSDHSKVKNQDSAETSNISDNDKVNYDPEDPQPASEPVEAAGVSSQPDLASEDADSTANQPENFRRYNFRPRKYKPGFYSDAFQTEASDEDPKSYSEAMTSPEREGWLAAMQEEMQSMKDRNVWRSEELPKGYRAIGCRWVFRKKKDETGKVVRLRSRLVVKIFLQRENVDFFEVFAPVSRFKSARMILNLAAQEKLYIHQFDVQAAFLYGNLKEIIYLYGTARRIL